MISSNFTLDRKPLHNRRNFMMDNILCNRIGSVMMIIIRIVVIFFITFFGIKICGSIFVGFDKPLYVFVLAFLVIGILAYVMILPKKIKGNRLFLTFFTMWCIFQIIYIFNIYCKFTSDLAAVQTIADMYVLGDGSLTEGNWYYDYISWYPNNVPIVFIEIGIIRLLRLLGIYNIQCETLALSLFAGLLADLAIYFTAESARLLTKNEWVRIPTLMLGILLIGFSEPAAILYTDILSLWTIPFGIVLVIKMLDKSRELVINKSMIIYVILISLVWGGGILVKPQVIIVVIATFMVGIIYSLCKCNERKVILLVLIGCCSLLCYRVEKVMVDNWAYTHIAPKEYFDDHRFLFLHYINMGLNPDSNGFYSEDDVNLMRNTLGVEEKKEVLLSSIRSRLKEKGFLGTVKFMVNKVAMIINDGNFSDPYIWRGEFYNESEIAKKIQSYCVEGGEGWYDGLGIVIQITYLISLLLSVIGVILNFFSKGNFRERVFIDVEGLALFGGVLFIMLFEENKRYFYVMVPILVIGFVLVFKNLNYSESKNT